MQYKTIEFVTRGAGAWLILNRPKEMNSISVRMLEELETALKKCEENKKIRAIVITGKGRAFCAGANLKEVLSSIESSPKGTKDILDRFYEVFGLLRKFPKPVIAALNGITLAGGLELAMCCDIIFASEKVEIGDAHANFGIFPGAGGASILPRKIGLNRAKYLLFSGDYMPAVELEKYGLVNKVVPDETLVEEVENLVKKIASKSPIGLRRMKEVANEALDQSQKAALRHEMMILREHCRSCDLQEGINAFVEKRKPNFKGC